MVWGFKKLSSVALKSASFDRGKDIDPIIEHADEIISQVLFRINMYRLAGEYCAKQDHRRYVLPVRYTTILASLLAFLTAAGVFHDRTTQCYVAIFGGFCGLFATTMNTFRSAAILNIKAALFSNAEKQYRVLSRDLLKMVVKRRASWGRNNRPPEMTDSEIRKYDKYFEAKYRFILNQQNAMRYFPRRVLMLEWMRTGELTGKPDDEMEKLIKMKDGYDKLPQNDDDDGKDITELEELGEPVDIEGKVKKDVEAAGKGHVTGFQHSVSDIQHSVSDCVADLTNLANKAKDMVQTAVSEVELMRENIERNFKDNMARIDKELQHEDLSEEVRNKLHREKFDAEIEYKRKEAALDRYENGEEEFYMHPEDDPLLSHIEVLDGDADADGNPVTQPEKAKKIDPQAFEMHARLLINKVYYRQNTYLESSQYCDHEDFKLFMPATVFTLFASIIGFLSSSPLMQDHPRKISFLGGFLNIAAVEIGLVRNHLKMNARAEQYRAAALQYRLLATQLEEKLLMYLKLPEGSLERQAAADSWKEYFVEVSQKIRVVQTETNLPPLRKKVTQWLVEGTVDPNIVDQPCLPPQPLTISEKRQAACLEDLERTEETHEILDQELERMGFSVEEEKKKKTKLRKRRKNKEKEK